MRFLIMVTAIAVLLAGAVVYLAGSDYAIVNLYASASGKTEAEVRKMKLPTAKEREQEALKEDQINHQKE